MVGDAAGEVLRGEGGNSDRLGARMRGHDGRHAGRDGFACGDGPGFGWAAASDETQECGGEESQH
jgi:hypothetical protein